ncbi:MAG: precorrin-3B C(17)-methyltransferase [Geminicoccales bacterium]
MTDHPAIILLGQSGLETAKRLQKALPNAELHGHAKRFSSSDVAVLFDDVGTHLQTLYQQKTPILSITSAAIPIRLLAPILADKTSEPPVLAIAEDGSAVVPLLGGHHGANDFSRQVANALGIKPAITTAGDLRLGIALDQPPPGWTIANPDAVKPITAALLTGDPVSLVGNADWLDLSAAAFTEGGQYRIVVTDRKVDADRNELIYRPATLALGVGCERNTDPAELIDLVEKTLVTQGLAEASIAAVVSIELKAAEPAIHALADHLGVPVRVFGAANLNAERERLANPSDVVFKETGCYGVAEGAALAAAGAEGELIVEKTKSARATCAIARSREVIDPATLGRAQGRLSIIGIGPGASDWRTPEADRLLREAEDWVGYQGYLDLLEAAGLTRTATAHDFALGEEEDRAKAALDLAANGRNVALISSGDAGIYAMASLVFELLDREQNAAWQRIEVTVSPGISAFQAAAARTGAPFGHDFCTISLSDLLTPWAVIEQRLRAAADGDFVIALYNPASGRRRQGLARALAILGEARPSTTPVIIGKNLGRGGENVRVTTLEKIDQASIDMLSLMVIGSSKTRTAERLHGRPFVYTPRGYLDDDEQQDGKEARSA